MKWDVAVLHIDHGMRPDSADDAIFVEELAEEMGFMFQLGRITPPESGSIEGYFSRKRRDIYTEVAGGTDLVATGHTASDRAETLILRLLEGAGLRGLGGMDYRGEGPVRRPLLDLSRIQLQEYLEILGQEWLEDPTNQSDEFLRNRIRTNVLPVLESISPGSVFSIAGSSENLAMWRDIVDGMIEKTMEEVVTGDSFRVDLLLESPEPLVLSLLWALCGRPRSGRMELGKALKWLRSGKGGTHSLPGGYTLEVVGPVARIFSKER
jgi:tRNA(Ile)-lysidine synthase